MGESSQAQDVAAVRAALMAKLGTRTDRYPQAIEQRFPRILARIAELWGSYELDRYLEELMLPARQERQGFPTDVATELFQLMTLHASFEYRPPRATGQWEAVEESAREGKPAA